MHPVIHIFIHSFIYSLFLAGMTKQHLMSVMLAAREDGRRNRYRPANFQFPLNLACEETKAQGVVLRKGQI
jgi:hypothetical protein